MEIAVSTEEDCASLVTASENVVVVEVWLEAKSEVGIADWVTVGWEISDVEGIVDDDADAKGKIVFDPGANTRD